MDHDLAFDQRPRQVERLQAESRRNATNREAVEHLFSQKLELARSERDMMALQLGAAYEEIAVRDAALADSAAYMQVRQGLVMVGDVVVILQGVPGAMRAEAGWWLWSPSPSPSLSLSSCAVQCM
jgi:hypothetical protein